MSYNSKYTGEQVEALLDIVSQGGGTGGEGGEVQKTTEAEILAMGFTKNEGTITEVKMNGESKGASGVVDLGTVITEHQDISGKVDKVTGKQLSTEDFTTALKSKLEGLSNYNDVEIQEAVSSLQTQLNTLVSGNANDAINSFNEIIAFLDGIKDSQDLSSIIASIEQQIASKMDKVTLANVATSGSYNDLNDKPTIPSAVTESTVSGWGFTKNTGTYSKPSGGIPKADLSSAVQTSLGKADTALQSYTEKYKGTVTSVKINGATKTPDTNGIVDLGTIEGGGGSSSGGSGAYTEVNHGTNDTTFVLTPNTFHVWNEVASLDLSFADETAGVANEYLFQFTSGTTPTTLTLPDSIKWANDAAPTIVENKIYQVSVLKGLGSVLEFNKPIELIVNRGTYNSGSMRDGATLTFEYPVASDLVISFVYAKNSTYTLKAGETTLMVDWNEPVPPEITGVTPTKDGTYQYIIEQ